MKKLVTTFLIQVAIYVYLFIIQPNIGWIWYSDYIWVGSSIIVTLGIYIFFEIKAKQTLRYALLGILILWGLIMIYHPNDIYGISTGTMGLDFTPEAVDIMIFALVIFMISLIAKLLVNIYRGLLKKKNKYKI